MKGLYLNITTVIKKIKLHMWTFKLCFVKNEENTHCLRFSVCFPFQFCDTFSILNYQSTFLLNMLNFSNEY